MKLNWYFSLFFLLAIGILTACQKKLPPSIQAKVKQPLPKEIHHKMITHNVDQYAPIMMRFFKEENIAEVWKQDRTGRFILVASYDICKWSGKLGPKYKEGDYQTPEGFYTINASQMNPYSRYYLSFNIGFPNLYDQAHGRTGSYLMVHGGCTSVGCYAMNDGNMGQIYAFARDAFKGGQKEFQLHAFPFRMTDANMERHRDNPHYQFWMMLKKGYDLFETRRALSKIDVYGKRYVFDRFTKENLSAVKP